MTPSSTFFLDLLRPSILQILRAAGYHLAQPSTIDFITELAANYLIRLCEITAQQASTHSFEASPNIADVLYALEECGFLLSHPLPKKNSGVNSSGVDEEDGDLACAEHLLKWVKGPVNAEILRVASDEDDEYKDYLTGKWRNLSYALFSYLNLRLTGWVPELKKRHSKTNEEAKYMGTLLGKPITHGEVIVEGGPFSSIQSWLESHRSGGETQG